MDALQTEAAATAKVYQDFVPPTELVEEPESDTLLVYLPGFKKEHLRVQLSKTRNLVISGEHHVGDNTWLRFHKTIPISSNCDISKITAKFEDLILYITQPKLIASAEKQEDQKKPTSSHNEDQKADKQDQEKPTSTETPEPYKLVDKNEDSDKVKQVSDHKQADDTDVERKAAPAAAEEENTKSRSEKENISRNVENSSDAKSVSGKILNKQQTEDIAESGNGGQKHETDYGNFVTKLNIRKEVVNIIVAVLVAIVFVVHLKLSVGNWKKAEKEIMQSVV